MCSVNLINFGVEVVGDTATVQFAGVGPVSSFDCKLDGNTVPNCELHTHHILLCMCNNCTTSSLYLLLLLMPAGSSPLLSLGGLAPGDYRLRVVPVGSSCDSSQRLNVRFTVSL